MPIWFLKFFKNKKTEKNIENSSFFRFLKILLFFFQYTQWTLKPYFFVIIRYIFLLCFSIRFWSFQNLICNILLHIVDFCLLFSDVTSRYIVIFLYIFFLWFITHNFCNDMLHCNVALHILFYIFFRNFFQNSIQSWSGYFQ